MTPLQIKVLSALGTSPLTVAQIRKKVYNQDAGMRLGQQTSAARHMNIVKALAKLSDQGSIVCHDGVYSKVQS